MLEEVEEVEDVEVVLGLRGPGRERGALLALRVMVLCRPSSSRAVHVEELMRWRLESLLLRRRSELQGGAWRDFRCGAGMCKGSGGRKDGRDRGSEK